jgi:hypothetical protein
MSESKKPPRKRGPDATERAAERDVMAMKVAVYKAVTGSRTQMIPLA